MAQSKAEIAFYEGNLFWGCIGLWGLCIGVGFGMTSNPLAAHICFIAAWPWGVLAAWCALSSQKTYRWLKFVLSIILLAAFLYGLDYASAKKPRGHIHVVTGGIIRAEIGFPLEIAVDIVNDGDDTIKESSAYRDINVSGFFPNDINRQHENEDFMFREAITEMELYQRHEPNFLPIHTERQYGWKTKFTFSNEELAALKAGDHAIYVTGRILYMDLTCPQKSHPFEAGVLS